MHPKICYFQLVTMYFTTAQPALFHLVFKIFRKAIKLISCNKHKWVSYDSLVICVALIPADQPASEMRPKTRERMRSGIESRGDSLHVSMMQNFSKAKVCKAYDASGRLASCTITFKDRQQGDAVQVERRKAQARKEPSKHDSSVVGDGCSSSSNPSPCASPLSDLSLPSSDSEASAPSCPNAARVTHELQPSLGQALNSWADATEIRNNSKNNNSVKNKSLLDQSATAPPLVDPAYTNVLDNGQVTSTVPNSTIKPFPLQAPTLTDNIHVGKEISGMCSQALPQQMPAEGTQAATAQQAEQEPSHVLSQPFAQQQVPSDGTEALQVRCDEANTLNQPFARQPIPDNMVQSDRLQPQPGREQNNVHIQPFAQPLPLETQSVLPPLSSPPIIWNSIASHQDPFVSTMIPPVYQGTQAQPQPLARPTSLPLSNQDLQHGGMRFPTSCWNNPGDWLEVTYHCTSNIMADKQASTKVKTHYGIAINKDEVLHCIFPNEWQHCYPENEMIAKILESLEQYRERSNAVFPWVSCVPVEKFLAGSISHSTIALGRCKYPYLLMASLALVKAAPQSHIPVAAADSLSFLRNFQWPCPSQPFA